MLFRSPVSYSGGVFHAGAPIPSSFPVFRIVEEYREIAAERGVASNVWLCNKLAFRLAVAKATGDTREALKLTDELHFSACDPLWAQTVERYGGLDVLVNNAGVVMVGPLAHVTDGDLERLMATNVIAPGALSREMLPLLRRAAPSRIVNVGSVSSFRPQPNNAAYVMRLKCDEAQARAIADAGGSVIAQCESSSVVWGMPGAAVAVGACAKAS